MAEVEDKKFESIELSPKRETSVAPLPEAKPEEEGVLEKRASAAAGLVRGILESEPSKLFVIIALLGFIFIGFAGYMRTWLELLIYLAFLFSTGIYFFLVGFISGEKRVSISKSLETKKMFLVFLLGVAVGLSILTLPEFIKTLLVFLTRK